jgi:hypothetical protein
MRRLRQLEQHAYHRPSAPSWAALLALLAFVSFPAAASAGRIRLVSGEIDTTAVSQPAPPGRSSSVRPRAPSADRLLAIVQLDGPIPSGWHASARDAGATVHSYLPDHAYLVGVSSAGIPALRALPEVSWVGVLPPPLTVHPRLRSRIVSSPGKSTRLVILSFEASPAKQLEAWGLRPRSRLTQMGWWDTRVELQISDAQLDRITSVFGVFMVDEAPRYQLFGERAAQTAAGNFLPGAPAPIGPGYSAFLASHALGGAGLVAQVQDDGLDVGDDSNLPGTAHPDLLGRIAGIFNATSDPLGDGVAGHGEINAGIIAGNAVVGTTDGDGYLLGQGVAPDAYVYVTKIFRNDGQFDIGSFSLTDLATTAQDAGAIVSNNSWGAPINAYTTDSAEFDALARDADPGQPGHQPMIYFFAAGNDGPGAGTLGTPATAKNVISVGAAENSDADGLDGCNVGPSGADDRRDLVFFSSRGPATDGRQGVTLVSVGTHQQGPASQSPAYDGSGVCDQYWPAGQTDYARSSGTSHSTPTAAGIALLIYEWFEEQLAPLGHSKSPSPALMKAVLSATATDLVGGDDGNGGTLPSAPNTLQGWGSVNLSTLLDAGEHVYSLDQTQVFTSAGQSFEVDVSRVDPTAPIKIALAWTDPPALPLASPALVNDLDLVVLDGGATYLGNVLSGGSSTTGGTPDALNNLESVYLSTPTGGAVTVRVEATNIAGDALPGTGGETEQDFALFVWNAIEQSSAGTVWLATDPTTCDGSLGLFVSDLDLRGAGAQGIAMTTSGGDAETVSLLETAASSGLFVGQTPLVDAAVHVGDGILQVADGAFVEAAYADADDGTGSPAIVIDSAPADCTPPDITNIQASSLGETSAVITFETSEPADSRVEYGPTCSQLTHSRPGDGAQSTHAVDLTGLSSDADYSYRVSASDAAGNERIDDNGGSCHSFRTLASGAFLTELFTFDNDLTNKTLFFRPDGSGAFYEVCVTTASGFPTDPSGGTVLSLGDDDAVEIIPSGKTVPFFGTQYASFWLSSNGYLTFGSADTEHLESIGAHFTLPRISALFDDLDPSVAGTITVRQLPDRMVVSFENVPQYLVFDANSFQVEIFFSGEIRITILTHGAADGLVGLSDGQGIPSGFVESDFSASSVCTALDANLGFELAGLDGWIASDLASPFLSLLVGGAGVTPGFGLFTSAPTEGSFALLHGFDGSAGTIRVERDLSLPAASSVTLRFDYRAGWDLLNFGATQPRTFQVVVEPAGGGAPLQTDVVLVAQVGTLQPDTGDLAGAVDLTPFAGQSIRIAFEWILLESSSGPAFFQLDGVTVDAPPATITIAGTVMSGGIGVEGVVLAGLPGAPTTDVAGLYSVAVPSPFSGVVTPQRFGFVFDPPSRTYVNATIDLLAEDYSATDERIEVSFDFESGLQGFTVDNASGVGGGLWHVATSCESATPGHTSPSSLYYGIDSTCSYDAGGLPSEGSIISPPVAIPDGAGVQLSFSYLLETEGQPGYDLARVLASVDAGAFEPVASNDGATGLMALFDGPLEWQRAEVDLTSLFASGSNHTVRVRFEFATVDGVANDHSGLYIDDVVIAHAGGASLPPGVPVGAPHWVLALLMAVVGVHGLVRRTGAPAV